MMHNDRGAYASGVLDGAAVTADLRARVIDDAYAPAAKGFSRPRVPEPPETFAGEDPSLNRSPTREWAFPSRWTCRGGCS